MTIGIGMMMMMKVLTTMISGMCWIYWRGRLLGRYSFEYKFSGPR